MKKIFAILLALVMVLSLVACNNSNGGEATPTPEGQTEATVTPTPEQDGDNATPTAEPTPEPTPKPLELLTVAKLNELNEYKVRLIETESGKGKLEYIYANTASEEDLAESGFTKPLTLVETIIYDVTITKKSETLYEVSGTPSGVKIEIVGEEKDKYMQFIEQMDEDEFKRAIKGETLTGDDLEKLLYEIDGTCTATFTVGESVDVTLSRKFTQWGSRESVEEIKEIVNGTFKAFKRFENGALVQDGLNAEE